MRKFFTIALLLICSLLLTFVQADAGEIKSCASSASYNALLSRLVDVLQNEKGTYGVYLLDLKSGHWLGINHEEPFHAASTFKLPANLYLYEQIAAGRISPQTVLTYRKEHYEAGTGLLQYRPVGSKFTIATLARYSIVYSDNVANNILISYVGKQNVKNYMRNLGGKLVSDTQNVTCPRDMAAYTLHLLKFASEHPEQGNALLDLLENTVFNDRISKPLPVKVAHKIGNWPPTGTYNDVGYVKHPENPYVIAVFSKYTPGKERACQVIQTISRLVYNYQTKLVHVEILLNGKELKSELPPLLEKGRLLVPVRSVAEVMGAEVCWNGATKTAEVTWAGTTLHLKVGSSVAVVNNREVTLPLPVRFVEGCIFAPLRFIGEAFGGQVRWDSSTRTATVHLP
ncbi:MAG: Beta-lactamase [Clostridia bacterium 62_21]|nr:MAG: Beta-lactamase [Clostridia bacterium 62_21]